MWEIDSVCLKIILLNAMEFVVKDIVKRIALRCNIFWYCPHIVIVSMYFIFLFRQFKFV